MLVPKEMKVEHSGGVKDLTDEQLEAMIEHLKSSLEAQAPSAKVIEQGPRVVAIVGQPEPAGMAQHVGVDGEWHLGDLAEALDKPMETDGWLARVLARKRSDSGLQVRNQVNRGQGH